MGRPRGKSKKLNDESDEDGSGEEVSVSPTPPKTKRMRGRPAHKPLKDDGTDDVEAEDKDAGGVEEEDADDGTKPAPAVRPAGNVDDAKGSTAETGGGKKRRRRRRRVKRGSDDDPVEEDGEGHVKANSSGFRPNGSRRKSTPRRAAEAGLECK